MFITPTLLASLTLSGAPQFSPSRIQKRLIDHRLFSTTLILNFIVLMVYKKRNVGFLLRKIQILGSGRSGGLSALNSEMEWLNTLNETFPC